jgi:hypothetical protein
MSVNGRQIRENTQGSGILAFRDSGHFIENTDNKANAYIFINFIVESFIFELKFFIILLYIFSFMIERNFILELGWFFIKCLDYTMYIIYILSAGVIIFIASVLLFIYFGCKILFIWVYRIIDMLYIRVKLVLIYFIPVTYCYYAESDMKEFDIVFRNYLGQYNAIQKHRKQRKKEFNTEQTKRRKERTRSRKPREFHELPNGAFYKCDKLKRKNCRKYKAEMGIDELPPDGVKSEVSTWSRVRPIPDFLWRINDPFLQPLYYVFYIFVTIFGTVHGWFLVFHNFLMKYWFVNYVRYVRIFEKLNKNFSILLPMQYNVSSTINLLWEIAFSVFAILDCVASNSTSNLLLLLHQKFIRFNEEFREDGNYQLCMNAVIALMKIVESYRAESDDLGERINLRDEIRNKAEILCNKYLVNVDYVLLSNYCMVFATIFGKGNLLGRTEIILDFFTLSGSLNHTATYPVRVLLRLYVIISIFLVDSLRTEKKDEVKTAMYRAEFLDNESLSSYISLLRNFGGTEFCNHLSNVSKMLSYCVDDTSIFGKLLGKAGVQTLVGANVSLLCLVKAMISVVSERRSIKDLFFGPNEIKDAINEAELLLDEEYYEGAPVNGLRSLLQVAESIQHCRTKLSELLVEQKIDSKRTQIIKKLVNKLAALEKSYLSRLANSRRVVPYSILTFGAPGQGKSYIHTHLFSIFARVLGYDHFHEGMVFKANVTDQFFDNYNPLSQIFLKISELGFESAQILKTMGSFRFDTYLTISDAVPAFAAVADMHQKQKNAYMFKAIVMDSNSPTMGIEHYKNMPGAYYRRYDRVEVRIKEEYRLNGSFKLDTTKIDPDKLDMSIYEFKFSYYDPEGSFEEISRKMKSDKYDESDYKYMVGKNAKSQWINIDEFTEFVAYRFSSHMEREYVNVYNVQEYTDEFDSKYQDVLDRYKLNSTVDPITGAFSINELNKLNKPFVTTRSKMNITQVQRTKNVRDKIDEKYEEIERVKSKKWRKKFVVEMGNDDEMENPMNYFFNAREQAILQILSGKLFAFIIVMLVWYLFTNPLAALVLVVYILYDYVVLKYLVFILAKYFLSEELFHTTLRNLRDIFMLWDRLVENYTDLYQVFVDLYNKIWSSRFAFVVIIIFANLYMRYLSFRSYSAEHSTYSNLKEVEFAYECGDSYKRIPTLQQNVWNVIENTYFPVFKGKSEQLSQVVSRNVVSIRAKTSNGNYVTIHALGVGADYFLLNKHFLMVLADKTQIQILRDGKIYRVFDVVLSKDSLAIDVDLALLRLPGTQFRDITVHFPESTFVPFASKILVDGCSLYGNVLENLVYYSDKTEFKCNKAFEYKWPGHKPGQCGKPVFLDIGDSATIAALHSFGDITSHSCGAIFINRTKVLDGLAQLRSTQRVFRGEALSAGNFPGGKLIYNAASRSPFRFETLPYLDYFGSTDENALVKSKSKLRRRFDTSFLRKFFNEYFNFSPTIKYSKPLMQPSVIDGNYVSPYNVGLRKMNKPLILLDPIYMEKTVECIFNHLDCNVKRPKLAPLTVFSAINGAGVDPFIRRINRSTSGGYGWEGDKYQFLPLVDDINSMPCEELEDDMIRIIECYERGETAYPVFSVACKDEPRELSKCLEGKTRLFYVSSLPVLIVARMYLAPFYSLMVEQGEVFHTAVGSNPHADFDRLGKKMKQFSSTFMEGDYSGYDVNAVFDCRNMCKVIILKFLEKSGYNAKQLKIVNGLLEDHSHLVLHMVNDMFTKVGLQASGRYATAEDNSLLGLVYLVYSWIHLEHDKKFGNFFDFVMALTYGDDLAVAVKEDVIQYFNADVYQKFCNDVYNMSFTSAAKDAEVRAYMRFEELTFLKRQFTWSEKNDRFVAPLDKNSLYKSMEWVLPSRVVNAGKQDHDSINSFLIESYLHMKSDADFISMRESIISEFKQRFPEHEEPFLDIYQVKEILGLEFPV